MKTFFESISPKGKSALEDEGTCPSQFLAVFSSSACRHLVLRSGPRWSAPWTVPGEGGSTPALLLLCSPAPATYMGLVLLLDLCVDAPLSGCLVELPLGDLEEVCGLPEAHLAAADHLNGVLEGLVLG